MFTCAVLAFSNCLILSLARTTGSSSSTSGSGSVVFELIFDGRATHRKLLLTTLKQKQRQCINFTPSVTVFITFGLVQTYAHVKLQALFLCFSSFFSCVSASSSCRQFSAISLQRLAQITPDRTGSSIFKSIPPVVHIAIGRLEC